MATKIEGYGLEDGSWAQMKPRNSRASWRCATMVLHDDDHERVFTESEVRAIIARLPVQAMVWTPCVMLEDIAPAFGLSDPA